MDDPTQDLNFRMSKKIAQLTKVIYQLNCRNEDHNSTLKGLSDSYESEIADIMTDAKKKIQVLRDQLNAARDDKKIQQVIETMTRQHEQEKKAAMKTYEEFKQKALDNERETKKTIDTRISEMTAEVTGLKESYEAKLKELKQKHESAIKSSSAEGAELRALKDKEINDLVRQYNEKYKAMLAQQIQEQEELERKLNKEWSEKLEQAKSAHEEEKAKLQKRLAESQAEGETLKREIASLKADIKEQESALSTRDAEIFRLKQKEEDLTSRLTMINEQLQSTGAKGTEAEATVAALREKIRLLEGTLAEHEATIKSLTDSNAKKATEITALSNEIEVLRTKLAQTEKALSDQLAAAENLSKTGSELDVELRETKDALAKTRADLSKKSAEADELTASLSYTTTQLQAKTAALEQEQRLREQDVADLKKKHAEELARLRAESDQSQAGSAAQLAARHKKELEDLQTALEKDAEGKLAAAEQRHEKAVAKLTKDHDKATAALKQAHADEVANLSGEIASLKKRIAQLEDELKNNSALSAGEAETMKAKFMDENAKLQEELASLTKEKNSKIADLEQKLAALEILKLDTEQRLLKDIEELKRQLAESQNDAGDAGAKLQKLRAEIEALNVSHTEAMAKLKREFEEKERNSLADKERAASDAMAKKLEELRAELTKAHGAEISALSAKAKSEKDDLQDKIDSLQTTIDRLRKDAESSASNASASEEALRNEIEALKQRLDDQRKMGASSQAAADARHKAEMEAKNEEFAQLRSEINALRKQHDEDLHQAQQEHAAALEKLNADNERSRKESEDYYKTKIAQLEERKNEERESALKDLNERMSGQMQRMTDQHNAELDELRSARDLLERELKISSKALEGMNANCEKLTGQLAEARAEIKRQMDLVEQAIRTGEENTAAALAERDAQHKDRMEQLRQSHIDATAALQEQHAQDKQQWVAKGKQFQRKIADLEYKIANRESRPEDVAKINELLKDCREKDEALLQAYENMKGYKLELINKETTYNKVFGRQPVVAADPNAPPDSIAQQIANPPQGPHSAPSASNQPPQQQRHGPTGRKATLGGIPPTKAATARGPM